MNATVEYFGRQVAGSRVRVLLMILCQIGGFVFLVGSVGWCFAAEFAFFMVLLPALYLGLVYGLLRASPKCGNAIENLQS